MDREIPKHFRVTHHVCELDGEEEYTVSTSNLFGRKNDNTTMSKRKTKSKNGQGEPYFVDNKKGEVNELRQVRDLTHTLSLSLSERSRIKQRRRRRRRNTASEKC